jgi:AraC-like DNA-binding protein
MRALDASRFQKPAVATLFVAPTAAVYAGAPLGVGLHRSAVTCIAEATEQTLIASTARGESTGPCRVALVPAGVEHRFECLAQRVTFVYLAPTDALVASASARLTPARGSSSLRSSELAALAALVALDAHSSTIDPRVSEALSALDAGAALDRGAPYFAARAGLSTSRFLHVFRAHAQVAFRRYRLWARMRAAVTAISRGADLTQAALDAGFATPSHFSAAFRAMFGVAPSSLNAVRVESCPSTVVSITRALEAA